MESPGTVGPKGNKLDPEAGHSNQRDLNKCVMALEPDGEICHVPLHMCTSRTKPHPIHRAYILAWGIPDDVDPPRGELSLGIKPLCGEPSLGILDHL